MAKSTTTRGKTKILKPKAAKKKTVKKAPVATAKSAARVGGLVTLLKRPFQKNREAVALESQLQKVYGLSLVLYVALVASVVYAMKAVLYPLYVSYLGKDQLASQSETVFAPAWTPLMDLDLRWSLVALLVLSSILPLLYVTRLKVRYQTLKEKVTLWRWADTAVTAALMVGIVALLSGLSDLMTLKLIAGLVIVASVLAWFSERENAQPRTNAVTYWLSVASLTVPWLLIAVSALYTLIHGMIRAPWYVYALYVVTLGGLIAIWLRLRTQLQNKTDSNSFLAAERSYAITSLVTKVLFTLVLIVGLQS